MSTMLEDLAKSLHFYNDGESNLAHLYAMQFVIDHHATIAQNAEDSKRLKALEQAMEGFRSGRPYIDDEWLDALNERAAEIMRGGE